MSADREPDQSAQPDPADPQDQPEQQQDQPAEDDLKRKFREALAAKKGRQGEDHLDGGQQQGHAHGRVETKRTFRRKTG